MTILKTSEVVFEETSKWSKCSVRTYKVRNLRSAGGTNHTYYVIVGRSKIFGEKFKCCWNLSKLFEPGPSSFSLFISWQTFYFCIVLPIYQSFIFHFLLQLMCLLKVKDLLNHI